MYTCIYTYIYTQTFFFFLDQWSHLSLIFYSDRVEVFFIFLYIKSHFFVVKLFSRTTVILTVSSDHLLSESQMIKMLCECMEIILCLLW